MTTLERTLRIARDGPMLTLTLYRPEAKNALDSALLTRLAAGLRLAAEDPHVRAVILTGSGDFFATSAPLLAGSEPEPLAIRRLREMAKPVVAAINGPATGIGINLALACDPLIAADTARLGPGLSAAAALAIGLVNRVVPPEDLMPVAQEVARQLAVPPPSFRAKSRNPRA